MDLERVTETFHEWKSISVMFDILTEKHDFDLAL